ncbi:energy transducer TonB [Fulvivirga sediminis]|uniref:Energy transducer TonB n=1 Tax=Fulvivirga sediminis TaxID=2803949 RepID=A0A937FDS6_9BACT|nr:energy transducer TonB [Fulvivirga sediminis]MBL3659055.1 energy transducer TonB [Fulvivirga sediminis]
MKIILTILLLNSLIVFGQESGDETCLQEVDTLTNEEVYKITDIPAKIDGGMSLLFKEAAKRIKYSNNSDRYPIESKVFVAFIVAESGSVTGQRIIKNIAGTDIGEQLLEIVQEFTWRPAICKGNPVKSMVILPMILHFK